MNDTHAIIYNKFIGFRAPDEFLGRFQKFTDQVGRSRSAVARYLIAKCMSAYELDKTAIAKMRQEII